MRASVACDGQISDNPKHQPSLAVDRFKACRCESPAAVHALTGVLSKYLTLSPPSESFSAVTL